MSMSNESSTKPYLIRAIHEWCVDNGYTPYLAVSVDKRTQVPKAHVKAGEIVLNASPLATNRLNLGNEWIEFQARFSGVVQDIMVPVEQVSAIYARENGHGMAFDVGKPLAEIEEVVESESSAAPATLVALNPSEPSETLVEVQGVADLPKDPENSSKNASVKRKNHLTRIK